VQVMKAARHSRTVPKRTASVPDDGTAGEPALSPVAQRFILHWGEMGSRWGVNRTVAQIHALLYLGARPMHADEISIALGVARSNVSNSLKELQNWNLVRGVHLLGDRRDHFETSGDIWELFRTVVRERKSREFDPTARMLRDLLSDPDASLEPAVSRQRIAAMATLMESLSSWADEMLRMEPDTLMKIMKLGAKIQTFVRGKAES
jgi:DNA-binding transcriptional regulator GbsR (MarR family)